jgi:predicted nucleic acid-binding protein
VRIVLDASAAIEIALDGAKASQLTRTLKEADEVLAPDLLVCEVTNTIWKYHRFGNLDLSSCDLAIDFGLGLVDALVSSKELYREAFLLARTARKPAYDMFYLALCRREDATLLTLDDALKKEALRQGIRLA